MTTILVLIGCVIMFAVVLSRINGEEPPPTESDLTPVDQIDMAHWLKKWSD